MKRWRVRALVDNVLNPLWADVTGPAVEAEDEREALEIFRRSDHPRSAWHALVAVELQGENGEGGCCRE